MVYRGDRDSMRPGGLREIVFSARTRGFAHRGPARFEIHVDVICVRGILSRVVLYQWR